MISNSNEQNITEMAVSHTSTSTVLSNCAVSTSAM